MQITQNFDQSDESIGIEYFQRAGIDHLAVVPKPVPEGCSVSRRLGLLQAPLPEVDLVRVSVLKYPSSGRVLSTGYPWFESILLSTTRLVGQWTQCDPTDQRTISPWRKACPLRPESDGMRPRARISIYASGTCIRSTGSTYRDQMPTRPRLGLQSKSQWPSLHHSYMFKTRPG